MTAGPPENTVPLHVLGWARHLGPARVLRDAHARFRRGQALLGGSCTEEFSDDERRQIGAFMNASWAASGRQVSWRELRSGLLANGTDLEPVVRHSVGPWSNQRMEQRDLRAQQEQESEEALTSLRALLAVRTRAPELPPLIATVLRRELFGRITTGADADRIRRTMHALPGPGHTVGLAVLAAEVFGDAHALDRSTPLGRAVVRFIGIEQRLRGDDRAVSDGSTAPEMWRSTWASVRVACDQVSSNVLVLNLPMTGAAPAVSVATASPGEPTWLTLRSMAGDMAIRDGVPTVFVCENPSIVEAAADRFGARTHPLICTFGRPSAAALRLLLACGSADIRVQADADATGRSIVDALVRGFPNATAWRMPPGGVVYEEQLVKQLLADLSQR